MPIGHPLKVLVSWKLILILLMDILLETYQMKLFLTFLSYFLAPMSQEWTNKVKTWTAPILLMTSQEPPYMEGSWSCDHMNMHECLHLRFEIPVLYAFNTHF